MKTSALNPEAAAATDAIFATFRLHGHLIALGDRMVQPFGMTSARWQVMGSIVLSETEMTVPQIARNLSLSRQAVQRVANDLRDAGLISFEENPHHKRAKLVRLTRTGEKTYRKADRVYAQWANEAFAGLPADELRTAIGLLDRLDAVCTGYLMTSPTPAEGK